MATRPRSAPVELVPMRLADLDEVMEVERLSFTYPWSRQIFIEELAREWARLHVVREGGRVVAFSNYWVVHDEVHLLNVAVHPDARNRGHAARLIVEMIAGARRRQSRIITLEVRRSNRGAVKLYRSFGFRAVGLRAHYYAEDGEDAIVMMLEL
jgi:ribosomal-protein-alanine N-acetyltransferase